MTKWEFAFVVFFFSAKWNIIFLNVFLLLIFDYKKVVRLFVHNRDFAFFVFQRT